MSELNRISKNMIDPDFIQEVSGIKSDLVIAQETADTARTEQVSSSRLINNSISSDKLRITANADRIKLANLSDEVLQTMAGNTPVNSTPAIASVTTEKIAAQAVTEDKTNFLTVTYLNLFDKNNIITGKDISSSDHKSLYSSTGKNVSADYIRIDPTKTIACLNVSYVNVYDEAKNYIGSAGSTFINSAVGSLLAISPNASNAYIRVVVGDASLNTAMITEKTADLSTSDYFAYGTKETDLPYMRHLVNADDITNGSIAYDKTDFIGNGKNMFDKSKSTIGYYINSASGQLATNAAYNTSDYIRMKAGSTYTISPRYRYFLMYNKSKNPLVGSYLNSSATNYTFTALVDGFLRLTYFVTDEATLQVEESSVPTAYEAYVIKYKKDIQLTSNSIPTGLIRADKLDQGLGAYSVSYNTNGTVASVTTPEGTTTFTYNSQGQITNVVETIYNVTVTTVITYNTNGTVATATRS